MVKRNKLSHKLKLVLPQVVILIVVALVFFVFFFSFFKPYLNSTKVATQTTMPKQAQHTQYTSATTLTPPPFPDFSQAPTQQRNTFNLSTWKQFDDPQVGVRFKYPSEWGIPTITYRNGEVTGKFYTISFSPRSNFRVSGASNDFADLPRDGNPDIFKGFSATDSSFGWINPQTYCQGKYFAFCQLTSERIDLIQEQELYYPYQRLAFINRPGKAISGLRLGGEFLSPVDNALALGFQDPRSEYTMAHIKDFDNAIIQRQIDKQSLYTFDEFEKVFETIENY
jgi:hypothetical protein